MESNSTDIEGRHQPLVLRLQSAVAHMAPHQRDRKNGRLLVECLDAINNMEIRHAAAMLHTQTIVDQANAMIAAVRNLRDVQGRHHTQIAMERLLSLLPENDQGHPARSK